MHSKAVRKPLVAIILSMLKRNFCSRSIKTQHQLVANMTKGDEIASGGGGAEAMASARSESLYGGSGGIAPSGVQGQSPWWGGQGAKTP